MSNSTGRVYLDHNATTPLAPFLRDKIAQWLEYSGNPSSIHWDGREPKALLREARRTIANFINADPLEIVFTSGGSEANNLALKGALAFTSPDRNEILVSAVEHPSVLKTVAALQAKGYVVKSIPVGRDGQLDLDDYVRNLSERTALVSVMFGNNETGNIFPVAKMAKLAHKVGALVHCDGVQALGKAYVDVKNWQVDLASFSGHKFYSLKGCGFLYVKKGVQLESLIHGGGQERGRRAGTENVLAIAALGEVVAQMGPAIENQIGRLSDLRNRFESEIMARLEGVSITGAGAPRLCNTSSLVLDGVDGETLLMNLDMAGFSVSTGAACSAGSPEPSPALMNMGLTRREAQSSLRVSIGWETTEQDLEKFVGTLINVVHRLRQFKDMEKSAYA